LHIQLGRKRRIEYAKPILWESFAFRSIARFGRISLGTGTRSAKQRRPAGGFGGTGNQPAHTAMPPEGIRDRRPGSKTSFRNNSRRPPSRQVCCIFQHFKFPVIWRFSLPEFKGDGFLATDRYTSSGNFVLIVILNRLTLFLSNCFTDSYPLLRLGERSSSRLRHRQKRCALGPLCWLHTRSTIAATAVDGNPAVNLKSPPETTITRGARDIWV
jgi:hypothetical protein